VHSTPPARSATSSQRRPKKRAPINRLAPTAVGGTTNHPEHAANRRPQRNRPCFHHKRPSAMAHPQHRRLQLFHWPQASTNQHSTPGLGHRRRHRQRHCPVRRKVRHGCMSPTRVRGSPDRRGVAWAGVSTNSGLQLHGAAERRALAPPWHTTSPPPPTAGCWMKLASHVSRTQHAVAGHFGRS
jgi:hypothetical protein